MSGILEQCSAEAFLERLQTAAIKREKNQKTNAPKACDKEKAAVRRRIDDIKMAKEFGIGLDDFK